jgi:EpsI family protein
MTRAWPVRVMLAAFAVVVALGAAAMVPPPVRKVVEFQLEAIVPKQFGEWRLDPSVIPVSLSPDVQAQLDLIYEQVLARAYLNDRGERMMLSIAYGGDQRDALRSHKQEVCYRAQGFSVGNLQLDDAQVNGRRIPVSRFEARRSGRVEPVTYWMTMGTEVIASRTDRLLVQVKRGFIDRTVPDGMVVRISSIDPDVRGAHARQVQFANALLAAMPQQDAARFTGR